MGCYAPIDCWKAKELNENGRRPVVFNPVEGIQDDPLQVPCGKCEGCRADQAREWAIRMYHESTCHAQNSFLTLTYSDDKYPADGKINKKHIQDFVKRMRKEYQFRYFVAGEYGEESGRAHYHMVCFGQDFLLEAGHLGDGYYENLRVTRKWGHGNVVIGPAEGGAFSYVAGYCAKKIGDSDTFSLASNVPPLGWNWYLKYHGDCIRSGQVVYGDSEYPIPKAYLRFDNSNKVCYLNGDLQKVREERREYCRIKGVAEYQHLDSKALFAKAKRKLRKEIV